MNRPVVLLKLAALLEGATGLALMVLPGTVVRLIFASGLDPAGLAVAKIAGMTLFAFALACWIAARNGDPMALLAGMLVYNVLVGAYFVTVGLQAVAVGPLFWPVAVFHLVFSALLARSLRGLGSEIEK
jgi:hypothetical protein